MEKDRQSKERGCGKQPDVRPIRCNDGLDELLSLARLTVLFWARVIPIICGFTMFFLLASAILGLPLWVVWFLFIYSQV